MRASYLKPFTCEHCGYDLSGTPAGPGGRRCPECGRIALGVLADPGMATALAIILSCVPTIAGMILAAFIARDPALVIWTGLVLGCITPTIMFWRSYLHPRRPFRIARPIAVFISGIVLNGLIAASPIVLLIGFFLCGDWCC